MSATGKSARAREFGWPIRDNSSSARCGASGASISTNGSATCLGTGPAGCRRPMALFSAVSRAMARLKRIVSMVPVKTPVTSLASACRCRSERRPAARR